MQPATAATPRHLGLARRQSYNPLSTTKPSPADTLSLGALPPPQFSNLAPGQRSVPALESNRRLGNGVPRAVSGGDPAHEAPRTPGGSLVVGSQVAGTSAKTTGRDRWGTGAVEQGSLDGVTGVAPSNWPHAYEPNGSRSVEPSAGPATHGERERGRGLDSDFGPAASLSPFGPSSGPDPSAQRTGSPLPSSIPRPPLVLSPDTTGLGLGIPTPRPGSGLSGVTPRQHSPVPPRPVQGYQYYEPDAAQDGLAYGLGNVSLDDGYRGQGRPALDRASLAAYGRNGGSSQSSSVAGGYVPYPPRQYAPHDPYADYADPLAYFRAGAASVASVVSDGRGHDSGYAPSSPAHSGIAHEYRSSHQWGPMPDYAPVPGPGGRHDAFTYSPTMRYSVPGASFGVPTDPSFMAPSLSSQSMMHRGGMRATPEYIAPGPGSPRNGYASLAMGYNGYGAQPRYQPDAGRVLRSALLEEFRTNRHRRWELQDLEHHIVEFSGDQLGSRHIQVKLELATTEEKQLVFVEVLPNLLQLSTDVFANYVIQKLFERGTQAQKTAMAQVLEGHVLQLSLQMYGCRVVQKALEHVLLEQQIRLVQELDGHILRCARDAQSNHVVQRALERIPSEHLVFITDACAGEVPSLATHPYGCRVLQRIFENCAATQTRELLDDLHRYTQNLIQDQYGNYVIQWVIEKGAKEDRSLVIAKISGQLLALAQQKFASNVIEKCIVHADPEERRRLVDEVLTPAPDGTSVVKAMLVHPFANYVMQKILVTTAGTQREALFAQTSAQLAILRKYSTSYSKHLVSIEKLLISEKARTYST